MTKFVFQAIGIGRIPENDKTITPIQSFFLFGLVKCRIGLTTVLKLVLRFSPYDHRTQELPALNKILFKQRNHQNVQKARRIFLSLWDWKRWNQNFIGFKAPPPFHENSDLKKNSKYSAQKLSVATKDETRVVPTHYHGAEKCSKKKTLKYNILWNSQKSKYHLQQNNIKINHYKN